MPRSYSLEDCGRLQHILDFGRRASDHWGGISLHEMHGDLKTQDSVLRCLMIVGEAAWKVSDAVQACHPTIPSTMIAALRHRLVHEYHDVRLPKVHEVLCSHLPLLLERVVVILAEQEAP